jgi:hypothetical protein
MTVSTTSSWTVYAEIFDRGPRSVCLPLPPLYRDWLWSMGLAQARLAALTFRETAE